MDNPGLYICGKGEVVTEKGVVVPLLNIDVLPGDYLVSINSIEVKSVEDLNEAIRKTSECNTLKIGVLRGNKKLYFEVRPAVDALTKSRKLGITVQDGLSGVGTMTYVKSDGKFGALGHSIGVANENALKTGSIFKCKIIGVKLPRIGEAGELQGMFDKGSSIGRIYDNNDYGVFGKIDKPLNYLPEVRLGGKDTVKTGKAYIYSSVSGATPQKYEVEIIKTYNQKKPAVKSMIINVVDKKLLSETGGIVQGMSGSPIVQNGYLVGAVTHVFTGDSTKGYGIYVDWMINN